MTRLLLALGLTLSLAGPASAADTNYETDSKTAMDKMMADMNVPSTGDADRDFAVQMIAHHQGAIAMARIELRYGHNAQLRALSRQIIASQTKEVALMRKVLATLPPAAVPAPGPAKAMPPMPGMAH